MPSATPPLTQSSSSSSIAPLRPSNNSAPVLAQIDTHSAANLPTAPSTARTSIDSVLGGSSSATPMTPSRRRSPSLPNSPSNTRIIPDLSSGARPRDATATSATPSPNSGPVPIETSAALPRNASSSSVQQQSINLASPSTPVTATAPTTSIGGSGPVPDGSRNQRERSADPYKAPFRSCVLTLSSHHVMASSSLQWATLDEILDKLLFVSVSGDGASALQIPTHVRPIEFVS
jgi:hypothetical protein